MAAGKKRNIRVVRSVTLSNRSPLSIALIGLLLLLALLAYWGTLDHPLVFDDRGLTDAFLRRYGKSWFKFDLRWVSYVTFGWTYDLVGKQWFWYRLVNVLLHAAAAAALFVLLARLFEVTAASTDNAAVRGQLRHGWLAFFGALLFLLHPVAAYGVAYLIERPIVMATLFALLSLHLFLEGLIRKSLARYVASAAAYFLAVFSKEHSIMLPAVALALAILVRGVSVRLLRELAVPLALFSGIGLLVLLRARGYLGTSYEPFIDTLTLHPLVEPQQAVDRQFTFPLSVVNQGFLFFRYLLTWLVPWTGWMSIDLHPYFPLRLLDWPHTFGFAAFLAYPVGAAMLLVKGGKRGLLGFALLYPWLFSLTEVATVRVQEPFVLYRSYLWMSGLPAVLPIFFSPLRARWSLAVLVAACAALIFPLRDRLDTFSSPLKLWNDVVRKNTNSSAPLVERGYHNRGFVYLQNRQYSEALRDFNKAIELNARDADAFLGRGVLLSRTGDQRGSLGDLDRAIQIDPRYAEAYMKRCVVKMLQDRPADALDDCVKAVNLNPEHLDAFVNLGVVYAALNRIPEAGASYRRALDIDAANGEANYNYGVLLMTSGKRDDARRHLIVACEARVSDACKLAKYLARAR